MTTSDEANAPQANNYSLIAKGLVTTSLLLTQRDITEAAWPELRLYGKALEACDIFSADNLHELGK